MELIKKRGKRERKEGFWGWLFISPQILGLLVFVAFPLVCSFILCFCDWYDLSEAPVFNNGQSFVQVFTDPLFWKSFKNTFIYILIVVPLTMIISLSLALLTNRKLPFKPLYRAAFFLPMVTSTVAIAMVWKFLYRPSMYGGIINTVLVNIFHCNDIPFLTDPKLGVLSVSLICIWLKIGYYYIIFDAGLKNIPTELYEAADIDGAKNWTKIRRITIPMLSNVAFFVIVMLFIDVFGMFNEAFILGGAQGGLDNCMFSLPFYIYYQYAQIGNMGASAVASWVLFLLTGAITVVQFILKRRTVYEQ